MEENQVGNERPSIEFVLKRFGGQDAFRRLVVMHHQCFLDEGSAEFVLVVSQLVREGFAVFREGLLLGLRRLITVLIWERLVETSQTRLGRPEGSSGGPGTSECASGRSSMPKPKPRKSRAKMLDVFFRQNPVQGWTIFGDENKR